MLNKTKIALIALLVAGTASAALARTTHVPQVPTYQGQVVTDEGQGRFNPADGGAP